MMEKFIHPHKIWEDEQGNNKDDGVHRPVLPLLLSLLGLLACVLHEDLQQYLLHMATLSTNFPNHLAWEYMALAQCS